MIQYIIVCPLVFLAGLVDSIAGGGGLISLPAYMIAGVPPHAALGTNKLGSAMGTVVSTLRLAKHGYLKGKLKLALGAALAALAGSSLGSHLALLVPDMVIRNLMVVILPITAFYVLRRKQEKEEREPLSAGQLRAVVLAAAFVFGGYDGFYGPGTGTFLILVLTGAARLDIRVSSAMTKVINLSSNVAALITFLFTGNVDCALGLAAGVCCIAGHYLGAGLVVQDGRRIVRPVVLVVLALLFVKVISGT